MAIRIVALAGVIAIVAGCDGTKITNAGANCADISIPAITVIALDSRSRQPISVRGLVIARDRSYADTADALGTPPVYALAFNRAGKYDVTVEVAGYQRWHADGVVVSPSGCNVSSVPLAAWLISPSL